jgi:hypothetical protein
MAVAAVGVLIYKDATNQAPAPGKEINSLSSVQVKVVSANPSQLGTGTVTVDVPPTAVSSSLQTQGSSPGEASTSPLQSNANVNDPAIANNPLVQSLFTGSQ